MEFEYLQRGVEEFFSKPFKIYKFPKEADELLVALSEELNIPSLRVPTSNFLMELDQFPNVLGISVLLESFSSQIGQVIEFGYLHWHFIMDNSEPDFGINEVILKGMNNLHQNLELIKTPSLGLTEQSWPTSEDEDFNDTVWKIVTESFQKMESNHGETLTPAILVAATFKRPATLRWYDPSLF